MPDICVYFQVHQPYRLTPYRVFDIGTEQRYFDDAHNARIVRRVADKCYIPANRLLTRLIRESGGAFQVAMSVSGVLLDQLEAIAPDAFASFLDLVATGGVELLGETYYHSLAVLADPEEFAEQVGLHRSRLGRTFGVEPRVFRNTELIFSDAIAPIVARLGFAGALVEGASHVLGWRSPAYVYESAAAPGLRLLARHYRLSDDIAFRFSSRQWDGWPLRAERFASWLAATPGECVNLFMDYETFGEHQWAESGIFEFLAELPEACRAAGLRFVQPSSQVARAPVDRLSFPRPTSWADQERDVSAWLGNRMQRAALDRVYGLRRAVDASGDDALRERWRRLTTSDHLYWMATKDHSDGEVHSYFSPYATPYDGFIRFMNVLQDIEQKAAASVRRPAFAEMAVAC
jgi:alpha-amylase